MTLIEFLSDLRSRGVELNVQGDRLNCNAPKGVMTAAIREELGKRKQEIIKLLGEPSKLNEVKSDGQSSEFGLSRSQRRLWFLDQMDPGNPVYNIAIAFRLDGTFHRGAFEEAMRTIVRRHDSLRMRFLEQDGMPMAVVEDGEDWKANFTDLSSLEPANREERLLELASAESQRPFALDKGPLFRVSIYRKNDREHVALMVMHHIISDGWSIGVIARELGILYEAQVEGKTPSLPTLAMRYRDFVQWEAEEEKRISDDDAAYWRKQLGGELPQLALPADHPRPAVQTYRGGSVHFDLDPALEEKLQKFAREHNATFFMVLTAAFSTILRHYTRQEDILIGTPTAGRMKSGFENLIGFFVNNLVLRVNLAADPTFEELLGRVRNVALEAFEHQATPFDQLVEMLQPDRSPDRSPIFQVLFALQNMTIPRLKFADLEMRTLDLPRNWARFDLAVDVYPYEKHLRCNFEFNKDIYEEASIRQMMQHYLRILENLCDEAGHRIGSMTLLDASERHQLIETWNQTDAPMPAYSTVPAWFRAQAKKTPASIALEMEGRSLSYEELDKRSDKVAADLKTRGVGRNSIVGIFMQRSPEMIIGLLGILKAGAAYLPLDPALPSQRMEFLLSDAQVALILTERELCEKLTATNATLHPFEDIRDADTGDLPHDLQGSDLAYLIYTSGSTGNPKGTEIHHEALVNLLQSMLKEPGLKEGDTLVGVTTISFDIAGLEIFGTLVSGAKLVLASREQAIDPERLTELLSSSNATVLQATPSTWRMLVESGWMGSPRLRMWCGGEALSPDLAESLISRGRELWNLYGPTETTIWSAAHRVGSGEAPILIGRPIDNTQMYILADNLQPVPLGVAGELFIGGVGVARGYWNRPDLTASRFLPDPFDPAGKRRMYRTGDLARYQRDGQIQLLGRTDHQIKLRGHRIECGEIELAIERHPSVRQAVVIVHGEGAGKQLVAYIRFQENTGEAEPVRTWLHEVLPDYMVPAIFIPQEEFPQTPNGKIDRKRLPPPQAAPRARDVATVSARSRTEQKLSELWAHVLRIDKPGIRENFFDLGGHSLLLVQLHSQLKREFNTNLAVVDLFRYPTIEALASFLDRKSTANPVPVGADVS